MTFQEAIRVCLNKYAEFNGRASRPEFWWFTLFVILITCVASIFSHALAGLVTLGTILPQLAVGARRLHDIGKSGWWLLFLLIPFVGDIVLIILWAQPGIAPANADPTGSQTASGG